MNNVRAYINPTHKTKGKLRKKNLGFIGIGPYSWPKLTPIWSGAH